MRNVVGVWFVCAWLALGCGGGGGRSEIVIEFGDLPCTTDCARGGVYRGSVLITHNSGSFRLIWQGISTGQISMGETQTTLERTGFSSGLDVQADGETAEFFYSCTGEGGTMSIAATVDPDLQSAVTAATPPIDIRCPETEIEVTGSSGDVADGGVDNTGAQVVGIAVQRTFTIKNVGTAPLTIGALSATDQFNCSMVTVMAPTGPVAPAGNTTMVLSVTPLAPGPFNCDLAVVNNDLNETPFNISIIGTAMAAPASEIVVENPSQTSIDDGGVDALGSSPAGSIITRVYTIKNIGTASMTLGTVTFPTTTNCTFGTFVNPTSPVAVSASVAMTVTFTPTAPGPFSCALSIPNNDPNENPFDFTITGNAGNALAPEIDVDGIADGGSDPVGTKVAGQAFVRSYGISNLGNTELVITGAVAGIGSNCMLMVVLQPSLSVSTGAATSFQVTAIPLAAGIFSCPMTVISNDADENPYDITIDGTATPAPAPEIEVTASGTINDGGSFDLGTRFALVSSAQTFTIGNAGNANLTVGMVTLSNLVNVTATVLQPGASVAPAGTTSFVISYTPQSVGAFSFSYSFTNNDSDETPFDHNLAGIAIAAPEINISGPQGAIANNGAYMIPGSPQNGNPIDLSFSVANAGPGLLTNVNAIVSTLTNCDASITGTTLPMSIAAGSSAFMGIRVTPMNPGAFSCQFAVGSNDPDEFPYFFSVTGTAVGFAGMSISGVPNPTDELVGTQPAGQDIIRSYIIDSTGNIPLTFGTATFTTLTNCSAAITIPSVQPIPSIAPGDSFLISVRYTPTMGGPFKCELSIPNNTSGNNPYVVGVSGNVSSVGNFAGMTGSYNGTNACGISFMSLSVTSSIVANSFGANGNVTFQIDPTNPNSAFVAAMIIFGIGGHNCFLIRQSAFSILLHCERPGASCDESFSKL